MTFEVYVLLLYVGLSRLRLRHLLTSSFLPAQPLCSGSREANWTLQVTREHSVD